MHGITHRNTAIEFCNSVPEACLQQTIYLPKHKIHSFPPPCSKPQQFFNGLQRSWTPFQFHVTHCHQPNSLFTKKLITFWLCTLSYVVLLVVFCWLFAEPERTMTHCIKWKLCSVNHLRFNNANYHVIWRVRVPAQIMCFRVLFKAWG